MAWAKGYLFRQPEAKRLPAQTTTLLALPSEDPRDSDLPKVDHRAVFGDIEPELAVIDSVSLKSIADKRARLGILAYNQKRWDNAVLSYCGAIPIYTHIVQGEVQQVLKTESYLERADAVFHIELMAEHIGPNILNAGGRETLKVTNADIFWTLALSDFGEVTRREPTHARAWRELGILHAKRANYHAAQESLQCSLSLCPDDEEAHRELARVLGDMYRTIRNRTVLSCAREHYTWLIDRHIGPAKKWQKELSDLERLPKVESKLTRKG